MREGTFFPTHAGQKIKVWECPQKSPGSLPDGIGPFISAPLCLAMMPSPDAEADKGKSHAQGNVPRDQCDLPLDALLALVQLLGSLNLLEAADILKEHEVQAGGSLCSNFVDDRYSPRYRRCGCVREGQVLIQLGKSWNRLDGEHVRIDYFRDRPAWYRWVPA